MNDFTKYEQEVLKRLSKPKYSFKEVEQKIIEHREKEGIYCKCIGKWICDYINYTYYLRSDYYNNQT